MLTTDQELKILKSELVYQTSRSGGKGGQNVNKVESKVEISFDVTASRVLTETQKQQILLKVKDLVDGNVIKISSSRYRGQLDNKEDAKDKLISILRSALKVRKKRKATKPSRAALKKRRADKEKRSEIKSNRRG